MEFEIFQDLPSVSWRTKTIGGIIQSKSKVLRTREATGVSLCPSGGSGDLNDR
jgi:hypothetical protein